MNVLADLMLISPSLVLACSAAIVLLLTVSGGHKRQGTDGAHLTTITLVGLVLAGVLLYGQLGTHRAAFSGAVLSDGLVHVFGMIALMGAAIAALLAHVSLREQGQSLGEFLALVLLATLGMLVVAMAGDLMILFMGIEIMSLAVYVLAGYRRSSRSSQEAAFKYFIYGAYASAFMLFGIALLYGEVGRLTGTAAVDFAAVRVAFSSAAQISMLGWVGVTFLICGLGFKVAAVPFHMWAPDVYNGAPSPATAFMAVGIKVAAFAGLCRLLGATLIAHDAQSDTFIQIFEVFAILSMVLGNLVAIRQRRIKRMLAYSSIAHAGYVLVGIAAWVANPQSQTLSAVAFYLFAYTAMTLGAFGVVIAFEQRKRTHDITIEDLNGTGRRYPALGLAMAVFMFSLAGIPPSAGFFGKLALLTAAVGAGRMPVVLIAVLASALGAFYYLRVLVAMYMQPKEDACLDCIRSPWLTAALFGSAAITVFAGILPEPYFSYASEALSNWRF